jgi:endonuclease/exonuclease/phosphatase family metal-dependent hydrolase
LRLLSYNIRLGGNGREKWIAGVINSCSPDMVILQEAIRPEVVERLAKECSLPKWGASTGDSLAYLARTDIAAPGSSAFISLPSIRTSPSGAANMN